MARSAARAHRYEGMRGIYRQSKWLHKYVGLVLIVFVIWMSASGILLNHPELIRDASVPRWLVPPQYRLQNWSRGALRTAVFDPQEADRAWIGGTQGVWETRDGGRTFRRRAAGFPESWIDRQTSTLLRLEDGRLLAGTRGGLFVLAPDQEAWCPVPLSTERESVRKLLRAGPAVIAVTDSGAYRGRAGPGALSLERAPLRPEDPDSLPVPLVRAVFDLHSGQLWGLPGRLLFDFVGLVLIFLAVSAFYVWFWPWRRRRAKSRGEARTRDGVGRYRWMLAKHLKYGIWLAVFLLVIGGTGFFMRPPMIVAIAAGRLAPALYPGPLPENRWHEQIHNALYDHVEDRILLETRQGFFTGPADFGAPFVPTEAPGPVFVMGSNVLEPYGAGGYLVGSFSGLFHLERGSGRAIDLFTQRPAADVSLTRPAEHMVTGFLRTPDGHELAVTHHEGLLRPTDASLDARFEMPVAMDEEFRLPLWNFLFELHNGRILADLIGPFYALVVPLGSLLFLIVTVTGVYDWWKRR